jgi:hypothetical protein
LEQVYAVGDNVGAACREIGGMLDVTHLVETFNKIKQISNEMLLKNTAIESEAIGYLVESINEKYFYSTSPLKAYLEELMLTKGLQGYIKEFSDEMTFRDFYKVKGRSNDELSGI